MRRMFTIGATALACFVADLALASPLVVASPAGITDGLVLHDLSGDATDPRASGSGEAHRLPPNLPGWPLYFDEWLPRGSALLVQADADIQLEILLISHKTSKRIHLLNHDGTELPGWPIALPGGNYAGGGPTFGDLDGDGEGEIVALSHVTGGTLAWTYAFHTDGAPVAGFPLITHGEHSSVTVDDLDGDGRAEIIVSERSWPIGRFYAFDGNGHLLPGWPVVMDHVPGSAPSTADLDGDGIKEVVFESVLSLYVVRMDGSALPGFPFTLPSGDIFWLSDPTFADVDGDGLPEIGSGAGLDTALRGSLYLWNHDGTPVPGWPVTTTYPVFAPPSFADIDGDGDLEIVAGDSMASVCPVSMGYAWHHDGTPVAGWPVGPVHAVFAQMAVGDLDGDGQVELIWDDNTTSGPEDLGILQGYHHDGSPIDGWPLITPGATMENTVLLGDVDIDGDVEMFVLTGSFLEPWFIAHLWAFDGHPSDVEVAMKKYAPGRDGLYRHPGPVATQAGSTMATTPILGVHPHPLRSGGVISWEAPPESRVRLAILDMQGRMLRVLHDGDPMAGSPGMRWDGRDESNRPVGSGVYAIRLETSAGAITRKIVVLR